MKLKHALVAALIAVALIAAPVALAGGPSPKAREHADDHAQERLANAGNGTEVDDEHASDKREAAWNKSMGDRAKARANASDESDDRRANASKAREERLEKLREIRDAKREDGNHSKRFGLHKGWNESKFESQIAKLETLIDKLSEKLKKLVRFHERLEAYVARLAARSS
ncbi:MAG TPA: hypothetical protein VM889_13825 [Candidatus Thermoplasmatota archaeon]|nr:hypothetical protein [Candidatus Thermoplasmatota archaeon]